MIIKKGKQLITGGNSAAPVTTKFLPHLKQQTRSKNNSRRG